MPVVKEKCPIQRGFLNFIMVSLGVGLVLLKPTLKMLASHWSGLDAVISQLNLTKCIWHWNNQSQIRSDK